jgi:hypothetical protein
VRIRGLSWVGVKTEHHEDMRRFFTEVIGLEIAVQREDFTVYRLPGGDQLELFGPHGPDPTEQFASNQVVAGLLVEDIERAVDELRRAGVELIGEVGGVHDGYSWQHFRAPDGKVFELCSDPSR